MYKELTKCCKKKLVGISKSQIKTPPGVIGWQAIVTVCDGRGGGLGWHDVTFSLSWVTLIYMYMYDIVKVHLLCRGVLYYTKALNNMPNLYSALIEAQCTSQYLLYICMYV